MIILADILPEACANVPERIFNLAALIITIMKFGIPVLLIIFRMLDLGKAVIASKEDEIKKGQQMFIKRTISAVIVFFVIVIVQLVINLAAENTEKDTIWTCVKGFTNGVECPSNQVCRVK